MRITVTLNISVSSYPSIILKGNVPTQRKERILNNASILINVN